MGPRDANKWDLLVKKIKFAATNFGTYPESLCCNSKYLNNCSDGKALGRGNAMQLQFNMYDNLCGNASDMVIGNASEKPFILYFMFTYVIYYPRL